MADSITLIKDILEEYTEDVQEGIAATAKTIADEGKSKLRSVSPKGRTGKYRKGWRVSSKRGKSYVACTIYNTEYRLTHLLEKPHVIRNKYGKWGTSVPKVHIKPVEEACVKEFESKVNELIKNGG